MAKTASLITKNYDTQVCSIAVSDPSVISDLPTTTRGGVGVLRNNPSFLYAIAMGSTCICKRGSSIEKYVLFDDGWIKDSSSSASLGGTPSSGTDVATDEDVKHIFNIN